MSAAEYHPSPEEWREFLKGKLSEEQAIALEEHLKGCQACCDQLGEIDDKADAFLKQVGLAANPPEGRAQEQAAGQPVTTDDRPVTEGPGTFIGPYKLLQRIGEGGMGVVYMAEQDYPVRRRVALKIIKPGMDSTQVIARFEAERQALALMDHFNIARVLDANTTKSGRPYFVMELIPGVPITRYCDENRLTPRERLELFVPVCQAIQHAHQKGIIHRDIKPSNVLVTMYDGKPVPKVIDFGVAKAIEQRLTERTMFTQFGTIVGTFEYMAPEQAEMSALGVDTRSDIYSLGVLLYELLTGTTPLERKRLREVAVAELLRLIREEEPPKPSTRLSESGEALAAISAQRRTEPAKLTKLMRGELDWIVMKTLEKDRTRRYDTASGLARDVQHYLADEPVEACPPSAAYRLRKFARRYRTPLRVAAAFVLLLVIGAAGSIWQAVQARQERDRAVSEKQRADGQAAIAKAVSDFLQNDLLAQADTQKQAPPDKRADPNIKVRTLLDRAATRITGRFDDQPLVEAAIRLTIGETYVYLGAYEAAQPHLERALELRRQVLGETHLDTMWVVYWLGVSFTFQGKAALAEPLLTRCLDVYQQILGEEHPHTLQAMKRLANVYLEPEDYDRAELLHKRCLEISSRTLGEEHPDTLMSMAYLGCIYTAQGKYLQAEPLLVRCLQVSSRVLGEDREATAIAMNSLGRVYLAVGKETEAETLLTRYLEITCRLLGEQHVVVTDAMSDLAWLLATSRDPKRRDPARAVALAKKAMTVRVNDSLWSWRWMTLGVAHYRAGDWNASAVAIEKSMELGKLWDKYGWFFLAMDHWQLGNKDKARHWYDQAVQWMEKNRPDDPELRRFRDEAAALLGVKELAGYAPGS